MCMGLWSYDNFETMPPLVAGVEQAPLHELKMNWTIGRKLGRWTVTAIVSDELKTCSSASSTANKEHQ